MEIRDIVIIEDNPNVRMMLETLFERSNHEVHTYQSAEEFLLSPKKAEHAVYIIDMKLPGIQGNDIVSTIRSRDLISPIFVVSGEKDDNLKHRALTSGADDYIDKPFVASHLGLKVRNALKRANICVNSSIETGIKFLSEANTVIVEGKTIRLSRREYLILSYLHSRTGEIIRREEIISTFDDSEITERTIDVHVSALRRKLANTDLRIDTLRGKGYTATYHTN